MGSGAVTGCSIFIDSTSATTPSAPRVAPSAAGSAATVPTIGERISILEPVASTIAAP